MRACLVGRFVYMAFVPQNPGKIVEDMGYPDGLQRWRSVKVKFLKGEEKVVHLNDLNDFQHLVDDGRKKITKHEANLEKLKVMV